MSVLDLLRRNRIPSALRAALDPQEFLVALTALPDGRQLAAGRFGLWVVDGDAATRLDWATISKVTFRGTALTVTVADPIDTWPDGTVVLVDRPKVIFTVPGSSRLTDAVHTRVRRSVAASARIEWPGSGGWVVARRVPGRDGLVTQLRLDRAEPAPGPEVREAVVELAARVHARVQSTAATPPRRRP